ncbi:MAG: pyridoxamine 5'-phosphate oxidase family protein [Rhizobiales bacterium]|nr:pyridoxamine 5'-phosphate oxidase family protein [Hyphomicrobiales bacterium]
MENEPNEKSPIRPTNDEARQLGKQLMQDARFAALATFEPDSEFPVVSRIAFALDDNGLPVSLISTLALHTKALLKNPLCSLLVGEPKKGDPLAHPRITLQARAQQIDKSGEEYVALRAHYLEIHPKSKLYVDFGDFFFFRFAVQSAYLNGGFGKAFILKPEDLRGAYAGN